MILAALALVLVADVIFTWVQRPRFTATSTVYYSPRATDLSAHANNSTQQDQARDQAVDTEVEVIKSPLIADAVITNLHLDQDPDFADPSDAKLAPELARDALIDRVVRSLKVRRVGQTLLIGVGFSDFSPTKAARIANAFADAFINHDLQEKLTGSRGANVLLNAQIDDMRQKVESAEAAVQQYKTANNLLGASTTAQPNPTGTEAQQDITLINVQLNAAKSEEAAARARLVAAQKQLKEGSNGEDVGEALGSNTISILRRQRSELSAKVADLKGRYGPMHPDLKNAEAQLADVDTQIQAEINRIMSNLSAQVDVAHGRTASIETSLSQARGELAAGASASVKLNELQRNADAARQLYENVLARVKETSAQQAVSQADSHIDTPATPPAVPSSPNKPLNILLGLILGLGLGTVAAYVRETWNAQFSSLEDIEGMLNLPYLASIPTVASSIEKPSTRDPADAVCAHPLSSFAEAFRGLAATLMHGQPGMPVKVIGITSALPGEGKTVTTVSLARVQALSGMKVIILDCDLRRRTANSLLTEDAEDGLIEFLEGKVKFEDVLKVDEKSGAHFVPLSKTSHLAKSPFLNPTFDKLLADLRASYDLVILDTPPLLPVVDTRVIAQKVDALVLLIRWRSTPLGAAKSAIHHLDAVNAPITGAVLSQVNMKAQSYSGYSYSGYYNKDFKRYYHQT